MDYSFSLFRSVSMFYIIEKKLIEHQKWLNYSMYYQKSINEFIVKKKKYKRRVNESLKKYYNHIHYQYNDIIRIKANIFIKPYNVQSEMYKQYKHNKK